MNLTSKSLTEYAALALTAVWLVVSMPSETLAQNGSAVALGQLQLPSFPLPARVRALDSLAVEVGQRTSVAMHLPSRNAPFPGKDPYTLPLLFLPCNTPLPRLTLEEETALSAWLKLGGTMVVDWQGGGTRLEEYRESVEAFVAAVLPGSSLERIPQSSVIYRSFYRLTRASGRLRLVDDLYGVVVGNRYAVIISFNDVLSAVERSSDGQFRFDVAPGGMPQREEAVRLLVNLVVYALCLDYKDDEVHLEYLKSRRNWRLPGDN